MFLSDKGQPITYLWVPLDENAEVRARGAKFDRLACAWYVPDGSLADFGRSVRTALARLVPRPDLMVGMWVLTPSLGLAHAGGTTRLGLC